MRDYSVHRIRNRILVSTIVLGLAFSGCSTSKDPVDDKPLQPLDAAYAASMDALYQTARKNGESTIVFYGSSVDGMENVYKGFNKRYPDIEVDAVRAGGPTLTSKLQQEVASGKHIGDLVMSSGATQYPRSVDGWLEKFTPPTINDRLNELGFRDNGYYYAAAGTAYGISYNPSVVSKDEVPQWKDLVDSKWDNKIGVSDPSIPNATSTQLAQLKFNGIINDDWIRSFHSQSLNKVADSPQLNQDLATGKSPIAFGLGLGYLAKAKKDGAPIDMLFPSPGGSMITPTFIGVMAKAPHPAAAKLFYSWLFTPEGQAASSANGEYPLVEGSNPPDGYPPIEDIDNLLTFPPDDQAGKGLSKMVQFWADQN